MALRCDPYRSAPRCSRWSLSTAAPLYITSAGPVRVLPVSVGGACGKLGSRTRNVLLFRTPVTPGFEPPGGSDYREYTVTGRRTLLDTCFLSDPLQKVFKDKLGAASSHLPSHSPPHPSLSAANYLTTTIIIFIQIKLRILSWIQIQT